MISNEQKRKAKEKVKTELKKFVGIAFYLWVFLSLFEIHRFVVLREANAASLSGYRLGFAAINALILGKVILIGKHFTRESGSGKTVLSTLYCISLPFLRYWWFALKSSKM